MENFEFQRFITIGQYLPTGSPIHRLDARTRLLTGLLLMLALTVSTTLTGIGVALVTLVILFSVARVPLRYALRGLLPPLPFIMLLAVLQIFWGVRGEVSPALFTIGPLVVTMHNVLGAVILVLRFVALILLISLLSLCISTTEIVHGIDSLLAPLARMGLPVHDFVMMVQIALHFLPLLAREAERIAKAQASRGADWGTRRGGLLRRTRQALPMLIPLFLTSLQRAENLALAMQARGYDGGKGRTSMVVLRFQLKDLLALLLSAAIAAAIVFLPQ